MCGMHTFHSELSRSLLSVVPIISPLQLTDLLLPAAVRFTQNFPDLYCHFITRINLTAHEPGNTRRCAAFAVFIQNLPDPCCQLHRP
jgi:hypothetical protein